jgi:hypothetical protein
MEKVQQQNGPDLNSTMSKQLQNDCKCSSRPTHIYVAKTVCELL